VGLARLGLRRSAGCPLQGTESYQAVDNATRVLLRVGARATHCRDSAL
jgi:hypothetical protein